MAIAQQAGTQTLEEIQDFKGKYPKQLWYLFLSEMWERFAFYGMRGMLIVFMVQKLGLTDADANLQYGATQAFVYALAFIGGLFADKMLGFRKSIFWGGLLMITGSFMLAFSPHDLFYMGISITIVGTGFFKPNISTMVGQLYKAGDPRQDAGFGLFYSGINIGALLGGILCIHVANNYSWNAAFSLAGIGMSIGLIIFIFTKRTLGPIGLSPLAGKLPPNKILAYDIMVYVGSLLAIPLIYLLVQKSAYTDRFMYTVGPLAMAYIIFEIFRCGGISEKKKGGILYTAILLPIVAIILMLFLGKSHIISAMQISPRLYSIIMQYLSTRFYRLALCIFFTAYSGISAMNSRKLLRPLPLLFLLFSSGHFSSRPEALSVYLRYTMLSMNCWD